MSQLTLTNKIINGDCLDVLTTIPDASIDCCVTSPPYFGLRDYGHDGQIGLEETPDAFVAKMVEVFTEVKRVLKKDATLWLNLGDSYNGSGGPTTTTNFGRKNDGKTGEFTCKPRSIDNLKPKDLIGIPWMVAFALRQSGWYLRQDIIWNKPNPMPESVTDRCTKAHEYIFLLSKSAKYYYDTDAIKTLMDCSDHDKRFRISKKRFPTKLVNGIRASKTELREFANKRSVWTVTTKPFSDAHFATFPEDLIVDMIKAGCPENGIVLDPFMGAGTTALVAQKLNRNYLGIELNPEYIKIAENRLYNELGMFNTKT